MQAELLTAAHFLKLRWIWHSLALHCLHVRLKGLQYNFLCFKLFVAMVNTWKVVFHKVVDRCIFFLQFSFGIFRVCLKN